MIFNLDNQDYKLFNEDAFKIMSEIPDASIDVIFADPPYFLSNNGVTCKSGKFESVNKGSWDEGNVEKLNDFNVRFLREAKRILKPNGTIWISGTMHSIYSVGYNLQLLGYRILNNITWEKTNPAPNLSCKMFTHSTETILWATPHQNSKYYYNYDLMKSQNNDKQMKDVWRFGTTKPSEKKLGKHPTQKPLDLLNRIILASTNEEDIILDPFMGSGTTGVAALRNNRKFVGVELEENYFELSKRRIESEVKSLQVTLSI